MKIKLESHNPNWKKTFFEEKEKLLNALSDNIMAIEHIGSTSIPNIHAKPVIDILIGVKELEKVTEEEIKKLESLGYEYISAYEKDLPFRRFFLKNDLKQKRTHHIHLVHHQSAWWHRHILFRDYLCKHPEEAEHYEKLKLDLAETMNMPGTDVECKERFFEKHIKTDPGLTAEYHRLEETLGESFTFGNQYALAKSKLIENINQKAYFDFDINKPQIELKHLSGYLPQTACYELYKNMYQDPDFIQCYGVKLNDQQIRRIINRHITHWDQHQYGLYAWFDKATRQFVGNGGLIHSEVDGEEVIELAYALNKKFWGKGLACEIGEHAILQAFSDLALENIVCFTITSNQRSLRVIKKLGFTYEKDFVYKNLAHKLHRMHRNYDKQNI